MLISWTQAQTMEWQGMNAWYDLLNEDVVLTTGDVPIHHLPDTVVPGYVPRRVVMLASVLFAASVAIFLAGEVTRLMRRRSSRGDRS